MTTRADAHLRVLFTLGAEAAAVARGEDHRRVANAVDALFYAAPTSLEVFGVRVEVVHLVHPHLFIKRDRKWMARHREWCTGNGADLVQRVLTR